MGIGTLNWRLARVAVFLVGMIVLNAIPSPPVAQTPEQNAQAAVGPCTVRHWGWPAPLFSQYGGEGYISPLTILVTEAKPIFSEWHVIGIVMDGAILLGGATLLWKFRLPGLPGEQQIPILRQRREIGEDEDEDAN